VYEVANVEIPIYTDGRAEEELTSLKAYTYNLENGKVYTLEFFASADKETTIGVDARMNKPDWRWLQHSHSPADSGSLSWSQHWK
jgi:hypothetical protein